MPLVGGVSSRAPRASSAGRSRETLPRTEDQERLRTMIRKRAILLPLVAIIAFAMAPTAAQALEGKEGNKSPVHWQLSGKRSATGVLVPVIAWGTLKLESASSTIQCKNSAYIEDTNTPAGKAASEVIAFASFGCKEVAGAFCVAPEEERFTGANLTPDASPDTGVWPSVAVEEGVVNAEERFRAYDLSGKGVGENPIKLNVECYASNGEKVANLPFQTGRPVPPEGTSTPLIMNGTTATKPSEITFEDPLKETGHLYAETEIESPIEEVTEPAVKITKGSIQLFNPTPWTPIIKPGCRVTAKNLFRNDLVKSIGGLTELQLENKVNPGKEGGLATVTEPVKFNCGPLVLVPLEGTTKGKLKFVGYLDNSVTPLVTLGTSLTP
jgi:hypothetical protein